MSSIVSQVIFVFLLSLTHYTLLHKLTYVFVFPIKSPTHKSIFIYLSETQLLDKKTQRDKHIIFSKENELHYMKWSNHTTERCEVAAT